MTYIQVIGIDRKKHIAEPHKTKTKCGIQILRKKLQPSDHKLYGCYECTY